MLLGSPGCATTCPSIQTQALHTDKTRMLLSLLPRLQAHGQNLKLFISVIEGNYPGVRNEFRSPSSTIPFHQGFTRCPEGLSLPFSPSQKQLVLFSHFPTQSGGTCLIPTHPLAYSNCQTAQPPGRNGMEGMGGAVAFLICIIFMMQLKISRKF